MRIKTQPEMLGIARNHFQPDILRADMEAQAQPKAICQREIIVHGIARVDRAGLLFKIARDDMAAVGSDVEAHMRRARRNPAIKHGTNMPHPRIALFEPDIIDEDDGWRLIGRKHRKEICKTVEIICRGFDKTQPSALSLHRGSDGFDDRRFPASPAAP